MSNEVTTAIETFVEMANAHPGNPTTYDGTRYCHFEVDKPGQKFTRINMVIDHGGSTSVHAFVDNVTGDLLKAAGWKTPAKGARYNLLTEMDVVKANFDWASGYLYAGARKEIKS